MIKIKMSKKKDWSVQVTSELRRNMEETACAAYKNGCSLINDSITLFEVGRFPRAAALAILAEEEFSKCFILLNGATYNRWDSNLYEALYNHSKKQAFSESMRDLLELFIAHNKRIEEINRGMLIKIPFSKYPPKEKIEEVILKGQSHITNRIKDLLKQDCFFVRCDKMGKIERTPDTIGQEEAKSCFEDAEAFKKIAEYQYEEYTKAKIK
jgi:AbiV family abortive infection protein